MYDKGIVLNHCENTNYSEYGVVKLTTDKKKSLKVLIFNICKNKFQEDQKLKSNKS